MNDLPSCAFHKATYLYVHSHMLHDSGELEKAFFF